MARFANIWKTNKVVRPYDQKISSTDLRKHILSMAMQGSAVHIGCSFSLVEIVAVLYERFIRLDWEEISNPERDVLALSKGHGVMALYACHKEFGWISEDHLHGYFGPANLLKGLGSVRVQGIEVSGGSLGHGFPVTVGMALAAKMKKQQNRFFCIAGDGEMNEGSMWESLMFSAHHKLDNLLLIIDFNEFQAMGKTVDVLNLGNLKQKLIAFGFETVECDGHDRKELHESLSILSNTANGLPKALIARTVKGKGVSFMENNNAWHYSRLDNNSYKEALQELDNAAKAI